MSERQDGVCRWSQVGRPTEGMEFVPVEGAVGVSACTVVSGKQNIPCLVPTCCTLVAALLFFALWSVIRNKPSNVKACDLDTSRSFNRSENVRLHWEFDAWLPVEDDAGQRLTIPSLTQPYYNFVADVHATVSAANMALIFSTDGNWHLALRKLLETDYFVWHPHVKDNYLITTSPPISHAQLNTGRVKVGNIMFVDAQPHLVCGPSKGIMETLRSAGNLAEDPVPIIQSYGSILLKRRSDVRFKSFWDLQNVARGRFASSMPAEGGSYNDYMTSLYDIANTNPRMLVLSAETIEHEAKELQDNLFSNVSSLGPPKHRSVPHQIATGAADVGLFFLHLAVVAMRENPGVFSAVYLSGDRTGETDDADVLAQGQVPLNGNKVATLAVARTNARSTFEQRAASQGLSQSLQSEAFTKILADVGLRRP
mmetsp:Transcript_85698/g.239512  ORF Transcript_85698/g.239512 Transcript_85698/m.239512 type:complete len:425 (+) Transcript_85698:54-1328(+)